MKMIRQFLTLILVTAVVSGCGGGSELGGSVTGGDKITITNLAIDTAEKDLDNVPIIDPFDTASGNFTLTWNSNYSNIYATVKVGINRLFSSDANNTIFLNGQCSTSFIATGCEKPTTGTTSTLQCRYNTNNVMTCGRSTPNANSTPEYIPASYDLTALAGNKLYLLVEICGDPGNGQGGVQCTNANLSVNVN